jgi:flagellar protein FliJ
MSRRPTTDQLIEIAQKKVEAAARALGALNARQQEAEAKLRLLVNYREDYFLRFQQAAATGIDNHRLHNFRAFMEKLDVAITEQHAVLADARQAVRGGQSRWHAEQQRLTSYQVLAERRRLTEQARDAKREQREQDEHAARLYQRNRASA